jgi:hypothetical protein
MDVQTGARIVFERFGHEAGYETVLAGDGLDRAFQQDSMVTSKNRILDVLQIDFELARREFRGRGTRRDILCFANIL